MKFVKIIICFFLFKDILLVEILKIGKTISTFDNSIIFESKEFSEGESMHFKFEINNNRLCKKALLYEYYDDINLITNKTNPKYSAFQESSKKNNTILHYFITKKKEELNGLNGDYLLMVFNCDKRNKRIIIGNLLKNKRLRIIENVDRANKTNHSSSNSDDNFDLIVSIVFPIWAVFVIIFTVVCCCYDNIKKVEKLNDIIVGNSASPSPPSPDNSSSKEEKDNNNIENNDNESINSKKNNSTFIHIKKKEITNKRVSSERNSQQDITTKKKKKNK